MFTTAICVGLAILVEIFANTTSRAVVERQLRASGKMPSSSYWTEV